MFILALIVPLIFGGFYHDNKEFFDTASEQIENGRTWNYVGPEKADPKYPSLSLQSEGHDPYILWKLKKNK